MTTLEPVAPWLRELSRLTGTDVATAAFVPPADVMVDEQGVSIHTDVRGIPRKNLEIELENDTLTAAEASLQDGVLSLRVPRPQEARPRRVEIRAGGGEQMGAGGGAEAGGSAGQPAATQPGTSG